MINFLRVLGGAISLYCTILLAIVLTPLLFLLCLWVGACIFSSMFLFAFWLFVTHKPHTLYSALYMAAWGFPPFLGAYALGYYGERLRARRRAPLVTLRGDAPFR